jgi:ankyrin repeat protein
LLVEACPASATVPAKDDTGHHALMMAFAREQDDAGFPSAAEVSLLASAASGGAALVADANGKICLHRAVEDGVPVDILEALVKASPQSIDTVSSTGTTPLMAAIEGEASSETVEALLVAAPSPNNVDRCIRFGIESGTPTDIVLLLADAMPVGTVVAESEGDTALHHAIRHGAAVEVMEALV